MGLRKTIFGRQKIKPNTFIGGVAATINTPALIASKLGISVSRIKGFSIVGNDIQFAITGGNYIIPQSAFRTNADITYYNDAGGLVTRLNPHAFGSTSKFISCNFPKLLTLEGNGSGGGPFNHSAIIDVDLPECTLFNGGHHFDSCYSLKTVNLPKLTNMGNGGYYIFRDCKALNSVYAPLCTKIGATLNYDAIFQNIKTGCSITINNALQTSNLGTLDGDLQYAINSRGAIVNYAI
ncbi:leucine-rich repeat protein [Flavobacterium sp. HJSW_4]|uniref:leucine-rich repeat protein n=1 Tax=Flavobacterium sp. HJSW_4 TaxID=3344660 RepID=UPI0035F4AF1A